MSPSPLAKLYLFLYNVLQCSGWVLGLSRILWASAAAKSIYGAYAAAGDLICLLQSLAFLEVLHAALGLVPSGVVPALMQWGGRTHFLVAVVRQIAEVQELSWVFITFVAWSISDIIRYTHYAFSGTEICPSWLTFVRYTAFIFMYPIGFAGETWLMYKALPFIEKSNLYSNLFSKISISYHSFVMVLLLFYPFLWLKLYMHMFKQRRSKLSKQYKKKGI